MLQLSATTVTPIFFYFSHLILHTVLEISVHMPPGKGFINVFSKRVTCFHRQTKLFKLSLFITKPRQAKSSSQLVNVLGARPFMKLLLWYMYRVKLPSQDFLIVMIEKQLQQPLKLPNNTMTVFLLQ